MPSSDRGSGRSTDQIRKAPKGALYVCPTQGSVGYHKRLAESLGRSDLEVVGPSVLEGGGMHIRGRRIPAVVVDHALTWTVERREIHFSDVLPAVRRTN